MAAIEAGRRGRRTLVLDHADRAGKKILISGGGRCNFTNLHATHENFLSANPHFAKSALARYAPQDFLSLVQKHSIPYHEKTLGQLFCDRSAHDILTMLLRECSEVDARIQLSTHIHSVCKTDAGFRIETSAGIILAASLIVATGGLSIPKMGATSFGYDLAKQFGHAIVATRPALVPLVFQPQDHADWCDLSGLSTEAVASLAPSSPTSGPKKIRRPAFREKILITHRGLSGPAILQISSYWRAGDTLSLDLAPDSAAPTADPATLRVLAPLTDPDGTARSVCCGTGLALHHAWAHGRPLACTARTRKSGGGAIACFTQRGAHRH